MRETVCTTNEKEGLWRILFFLDYKTGMTVPVFPAPAVCVTTKKYPIRSYHAGNSNQPMHAA